MGRVATALSAVVAVLLVWTTGCLDSSGLKQVTPDSLPRADRLPRADSLPGLILSAPVRALSAGAGRVGAPAVGAPVSASLVYISLAPGAVPTGFQATIRDQATGESVTAAVLDGGFDPVAIAASVGDTLVVEVKRIGSADPLRAVQLVTANRPPVVVRTDPPPKKVDVPLNSIMVVVFSTPIDPGTLNTESVQLWDGTTPVAGTVRSNDVTGLRAEFHPDSLLAGQTDYLLVVTPGIHDVNGVALATPLDVPFRTGTNPAGLVFAVVSAGYGHTCGVTAAGAAYCWGFNGSGELGDGDTAFFRSSPGLVAGGVSFAAVSAGGYHTCGVTAAGAAYCWGHNIDGQLGDRDTAFFRSSPGLVAGAVSFAAVSAGGYHTCGVTAAGAAYCWGHNLDGELGDGTTTGRSSPALVVGGLSFAAVSAGGGHTCGITAAGAAYCWGLNASGELGDGTTTDRASPGLVAGGLTFAAVSAGNAHSCGVTAAGAAYCWGHNLDGELGDGTTTDQSSPVPVVGGLSFAVVRAGGYHSCGVTAAGAAYCWGYNDFGELGDGTNAGQSSPGLVAGGRSFAAVSAGYVHTCGVTGGVVYCWGDGFLGKLGSGTPINSSVPVKVAGQP